MSHSHPSLSRGGAEIAAYQHFSRLREIGIEAFFIASGSGRSSMRDGVVFRELESPNEFVGVTSGFDHFVHANLDPRYPEQLSSLLSEIEPHIVHLHHYTNFGVESLLHIRRMVPRCKIFMTLHEYLAICHNLGQMVKTKSYALCQRSGLEECPKCFPDRSPQDFFLRKKYIDRFFGLVDQFISPSEFLKQRYVDWGLPADKVSVVENGLPAEAAPEAPGQGDRASSGLRIGFFGQISVLKGINVVIEAARMLEAANGLRPRSPRVQFLVYGDHTGQPATFRERFERDLEDAPRSTFAFMGPYANSDVQELMRSVDAVLVPSIWWENSPLVIQEAFRARRPVLCSNMGGMAEKVRDGLDGYHFQAGSPASLCTLLQELAADPERLRRISQTMRQPSSIDETVASLLALYRNELLAKPAG